MSTTKRELFERIGTKKQCGHTLSRELAGTLDELVDSGRQSQFVERAAWDRLIDEFGEAAVQDAIDSVQADIEEHNSLSEGRREPYLLTE